MQADKKGKLTIEIVINLYFIKYTTFTNIFSVIFLKPIIGLLHLHICQIQILNYIKNLMNSIIEILNKSKKTKKS